MSKLFCLTWKEGGRTYNCIDDDVAELVALFQDMVLKRDDIEFIEIYSFLEVKK